MKYTMIMGAAALLMSLGSAAHAYDCAEYDTPEANRTSNTISVLHSLNDQMAVRKEQGRLQNVVEMSTTGELGPQECDLGGIIFIRGVEPGTIVVYGQMHYNELKSGPHSASVASFLDHLRNAHDVEVRASWE